jgi:DNA-binding SARP family transcriptional activator
VTPAQAAAAVAPTVDLDDTPAIAVLGDVVLRGTGGHEVALPKQKREILSALAAAAGTSVPRDELLTALWGEDSQATRHRLKSQIAQLRPLLDPRLSIEHRNDGYRLCGPLELLDATRFERLVVGARDLAPDDAARRYAAALAQWRGNAPFAGVSNRLVDPAVWRLIGLRDQVVLALADCDLACSRPSDTLTHLERMFDDDPMRGDLASRLAALYALASRQADGLRVVQRHRDALAEIGAVIAPDVAAVEGRILRHDLAPPASIATAPASAPTVGSTTVWLPRQQWLTELIESSKHGAVVLAGEPGVGKTTLVELLTDHHLAQGSPVVRTNVQAEPTRPMDVVLDIVDQLRQLLPDRLDSALGQPAAAAALERASGRASSGPARVTGREELINDLAMLITDVLDGTGALLVVEDGHWLDSSSAEVIAGVLATGRSHTIVTSRWPVPDALDQGDAVIIELPSFSEHEVHDLLRQVLPLRASAELAATIIGQTGGNPLFVRLALDVLAHGQLGSELPTSIQQAVRDRTNGLSRVAREALQLAALLGYTFPLGALRRVRPRVVDALRDAENDGLIRLDDDQRGRFVHGLVADSLVHAIPAGTRVALHDELCRSLQATHAPAMSVAVQAIGASALDPHRAAVACRDASTEQAAVFEWNESISWSRRGLDLVRDHGLAGTIVEGELRALLGTALRRTSKPGSDVELLQAAELANEWGADELLVRVVTELCLHGRTSKVGSVDERARAHLERALTLRVGHAARTELLAAAATLFGLTDDAGRGRSLYLEARDLALASGDTGLVRSVLLNAHLGLANPHDLPLRRHAADTLGEMDDTEARWESAFLHVGLGLIAADRPAVERAVRELRVLTPIVRERGRHQGLLQVESAYATLCGRFSAAEEYANQAFALGLETYSQSWAMSVYAALILPLREAQRREAELWEPISGLLADDPDFITWHAVASYIAMSRGDMDVVRRELQYLRERNLEFAPDLTWSAVATLTSRPIWYARDRELAAQLYEILLPFEGQMTWNGLGTHGPVDAGLAALAATLGDTTRCEHHRITARVLVAGLAAPHLLWHEFDHLL